MKSALLSVFSLSLAFLSPGAYSDNVPPEIRSLMRSDYGCEVLLCMAHPDGPDTAPECRPTMQRLRRDLALGRPVPACDMAKGPNGQSYAKAGASAHDPCPAGTSALPVNTKATLSAPMSERVVPAPYRSGKASPYVRAEVNRVYEMPTREGGTNGYVTSNANGQGNNAICVSGLRGRATRINGMHTEDIALFEIIFVQPAFRETHFVDVYIDDHIWQRVRWQ